MEQGFAEQVWRQAAPTFNSKILGPHFEDLARDFTRRYAHALAARGLPGPVGTTEVADPCARTKHEVDVIALAAAQRRRPPREDRAPGEAKATVARRGPVTWNAWSASATCSPIRVRRRRHHPGPATPCTASTRTWWSWPTGATTSS